MSEDRSPRQSRTVVLLLHYYATIYCPDLLSALQSVANETIGLLLESRLGELSRVLRLDSGASLLEERHRGCSVWRTSLPLVG